MKHKTPGNPHTDAGFRAHIADYYGRPGPGIRERLFIIIFEADTRAGRIFDFALIAFILVSVSVVVLDSVESISNAYGRLLTGLEWFFTLAFTIEYLARITCVRHPLRYARSFFGIVDLLAVLAGYAALFIPEAYALSDVRLLRLLRIFRLLKLVPYIEEYSLLGSAIIASRRKILIFLSVVAIIVIVNGTLLYVVEAGPDSKFTSIPTAVYFAISAVTTVGFGDITPQTDLGRALTSITMLVGWSILAVPTGIITSEMTAQRFGPKVSTRTCPECLETGLSDKANYCRNCGAKLPHYAKD